MPLELVGTVRGRPVKGQQEGHCIQDESAAPKSPPAEGPRQEDEGHAHAAVVRVASGDGVDIDLDARPKGLAPGRGQCPADQAVQREAQLLTAVLDKQAPAALESPSRMP